MYLDFGLSGTAKCPFEVAEAALDILFCFCAFANCLEERRTGLEGRSESDPDVVMSAEWVTRPALEGERKSDMSRAVPRRVEEEERIQKEGERRMRR
jgi:hypothetical protein